MKIMNKRRLRRKTISVSANAYDNVKMEMAIMKKLDHPYILKLYEIIDDPSESKTYLIIDYVKNGSLVKLINQVTKRGKKKSKIDAVKDTEKE